jgi:hypothetical protein
MPTIMIVLNIVFAVGAVVVIAGSLLLAMATQHRDHRGPLSRCEPVRYA